MYRKKRKRGIASWFVFIIVAGVITWFVWPDGEPTESDNSEEIVKGPTTVESAPQKVEQPAVTPSVSELVVAPSPEVVTTVANNTVPVEEPVLKLQPLPLATTSSSQIEHGLSYLDNNQISEARFNLSQALLSGSLTLSEEAQARGVLTDISERLVFSPEMREDDPFTIEYIVRSGDTLSEIVQKMGVQVDWRFIQRINRISQASAIRPGQSLKLISGPFHAVIDKSSYRIDLYLGEGSDRVYVRSYSVGLGEYNSTPLGSFKVRQNSKLINPPWVNPRTRVFFGADNPDNPIGERWIGLEGTEERTEDLSGLGIHGTIEPDTIGKDASMGCVRMLHGDVSEVYEMLIEGVSTVEIR